VKNWDNKQSKWTIWKHALGSFSDEQTYGQDDKIALIRTIIVGSNLLCAYLFMINIVVGWMG